MHAIISYIMGKQFTTQGKQLYYQARNRQLYLFVQLMPNI